MNFRTRIKKQLADTITPVSLYAKLRDKYSGCLLLESSDYHSKEGSYSFICAEPLLNVSINNSILEFRKGNMLEKTVVIDKNINDEFQKIQESIKIDCEQEFLKFNGFYGYISYDSIKYFETIKLDNNTADSSIPDFNFSFFKYVVAINHFKNDMVILENIDEQEESTLEQFSRVISSNNFSLFEYNNVGETTSNITDKEFIENVERAKQHCARGDVFQLVLSRQFKQEFEGDDFNVYRALRSINPSPYLFYFDYGNYKLMGSSPEAQIKVSDSVATINPIAGTYRRTGDYNEDVKLSEKLLSDEKENAEHVMLVDLARNDLSKHSNDVEVTIFKEVQFFSHVIHLVSKVDATIKDKAFKIVGDTFPAGTLTGAPKYKAMQLIDKYENQNRGFYGGAVGFIGFDESVNLAIAIRSFVSKNNCLYSQAGAGITINSVEESELKEVNNKLEALNKALVLAENI
jgi:anthranilate synthase component 1